jgi:hypothetical protein
MLSQRFPRAAVGWRNFREWDFSDKIMLGILVFASSVYVIFLIYFSSRCYFSRDDFHLLADSFHSLKSILVPLGSHFRPVIRLHFYLHHLIEFSPFLFNLINVLLHLISGLLLFMVIRKYYPTRISLFASLIFLNLFSYNEILYWISQVQLQYCLIFCLLSIYFYQEKKSIPSILFLILASLSYELWVVLPLVFVCSKRKIKPVILVSFLLVILNVGVLAMFSIDIGSYGGFSGIKEIPYRMVVYLFKSFAPFYYPGNSASAILLVVLLLSSILLFKYFKDKALLPLLFYFVPAILFLMSSHIPSRFFYFSAISISIALAGLQNSGRIFKLAGYLLTVYLVILSLTLNYLDGVDYLNYSLEHKRIVEMGEGIRHLESGDRVILFNCIDESFPIQYTKNMKGRTKLLFDRPQGFGGLIELKVLVQFLLYPRGLKPVSIPGAKGARIIRLGNGRLISEYTFKVSKL